MSDIYSDIRINPDTAHFMRSRPFNRVVVAAARSVREVQSIERQIEQLYADKEEALSRMRGLLCEVDRINEEGRTQ